MQRNLLWTLFRPRFALANFERTKCVYTFKKQNTFSVFQKRAWEFGRTRIISGKTSPLGEFYHVISSSPKTLASVSITV